MANKIEFSRGDNIIHTFAMPATDWSSGGKLFFTAKPAIDDDNTDAVAVIDKSWSDGSVSDVTITINGVATACKQYACDFVPSDTNSIESGGADSADYLGEFQWVASDGKVKTFPPTDPKLDVTVYFDVKRKVV